MSTKQLIMAALVVATFVVAIWRHGLRGLPIAYVSAIVAFLTWDQMG